MFTKIAFCISVFLSMRVAGEFTTTEPYTHSATLRTGNIKVYWKFNESDITFEVHGETTGWIGIGFSPNGAMTGADIFVGWVKDNEVMITDRHGTGNTFPPLDPKQDIDVLAGAECDGWTMFKFSRQLAACENEYDREITQNTQRLIWAWGDRDPNGDDIEPGNNHGTRRGAESMYFLDSSEKPSGLPNGPAYKTFDIRMDKFQIPPEDTYYNCKIFELPKLAKKHHIVKYEPIIQEGNELNVHHIVVYRCGDKIEDPTELLRDERCYSPNMQHFQTCTSVIAAWAVGAGATVFPEVAGFSLGDVDDPSYIQLEMHYDNPLKKEDIVDSSGVRFWYTEKLREHDIGVLMIGSTVNGMEHFIPPGAESFTTISQCNSDCIKNRISSANVGSINVFSIMLHSHVVGRSLKLRHIRDGIELPPAAYDDHYDFNYQEPRYFHPPLTLKPTDSLQMECVYNTEKRKNITQGGLGTRQEMCVSFLTYFPKIDFGICVSSASKDVLWTFFGIDLQDVKFIGKSTRDYLDQQYWQLGNSSDKVAKTIFEYANELEWNSETIKKFESFSNSILHYEVCGPNDVSKSNISAYNVTEITKPYVQPEKKCNEPHRLLSQKALPGKCLSTGLSIKDPRPTSRIYTTTSGTTAKSRSRPIAAILLPIFILLSTWIS